MTTAQPTLAQRMGKSVHVSPLDHKLQRLCSMFPSSEVSCIEDWLVDVANARGCRVVERSHSPNWSFAEPPAEVLSNEELVVAICQLNRLDRPQMLRLAAQLISRRAVDLLPLQLAAKRERCEPILGELAKQALRVDHDHDLWLRIAEVFPIRKPLREPLLHWTRLAEPIMAGGRYNAESWRLVA
jgi:hypothetical protein